ncbi:MAG: CRISPR-associated protein [Candidatus Brocadia fulgida]|uniref:CRISPR-associated protein n=1 Tax=Candidatus Brocadia fulgida TaxID=380242 RepID=A0A0M2UTZ4_9BACT|nr:MAG: CRISPR-associated protein [Candidatus Brocadia fulgida]
MSNELHHNIVTLPNGKVASGVVTERHDMVLLFDAKKANPNGDPDAENMPRIQPNTLKGMVTDVCLKRKIRNFFSLYKTDGNLKDNPESGYDIFIKENAILQQLMEAAPINASAKRIFIDIYKQNETAFKKGNEFWDISHRDALCQTYFDLRAFGGVISTEGPLKGSFYGQVRGPIQFSFAESLDKVLQLDATITRCCSTSEKEKKEQEKQSEGDEKTGGNRTMGENIILTMDSIERISIFLLPSLQKPALLILIWIIFFLQ